MRIPQQVSDRVKEAPAQVLRAVFAGVGQVLLVADRVRSRAADSERVTPQPARPDQPRREAPPARPAPAPRVVNRWRSLDETGNVRLLSRDDVEDEQPAAATPEPAAETEPVTEWEPAAEPVAVTEAPVPEPDPVADTIDEIPAIAEPIAEPVAVADVPAEEAATEDVAAAPAEQPSDAGLAVLPVANYDGLTIASLRARLRNLDPAQLRVLIDYEKAHAGRGDVLTMFERRITKLESGA